MVLQPGDVYVRSQILLYTFYDVYQRFFLFSSLYIPPYWFHHVTVVGDEVSISVSIHTESEVRASAFRIFCFPLTQDVTLAVSLSNRRLELESI